MLVKSTIQSQSKRAYTYSLSSKTLKPLCRNRYSAVLTAFLPLQKAPVCVPFVCHNLKFKPCKSNGKHRRFFWRCFYTAHSSLSVLYALNISHKKDGQTLAILSIVFSIRSEYN